MSEHDCLSCHYTHDPDEERDLRTRLATAEAQVAAAQSERDMTRAMAAERAALRAGLAAAEEQVGRLADAEQSWEDKYDDLCRQHEAQRLDLVTARQALAAAEEQLADANRGYSLLCDEEARLSDDLAAAHAQVGELSEKNRQLGISEFAASRALEEMRQALKNAQYKSMMIVLSAVEAGEEREFIKWVQQEAKHIEKGCAIAALLAPERPREERG